MKRKITSDQRGKAGTPRASSLEKCPRNMWKKYRINESEMKDLFICIWKYKDTIHFSDQLTVINNNKYKSEADRLVIKNDIKLKVEAWAAITSNFNEICEVDRTSLQIQNIWHKIKWRLKKNLKLFGILGLTNVTAMEIQALFLIEFPYFEDVINIDVLKEAMKGIKSLFESNNPEKATTETRFLTRGEEDCHEYLLEEAEPNEANSRLLNDQISGPTKITDGLTNFNDEQNFCYGQDVGNSWQISVPKFINREVDNTGIQADTLEASNGMNTNSCVKLNGNLTVGLSAVHHINLQPSVNKIFSETSDSNFEKVQNHEIPLPVNVESLSTQNVSNPNGNDMMLISETELPFQMNENILNDNENNTQITRQANFPPNTYFLLPKSTIQPGVNIPTSEKENLTVKDLLLSRAKMEETKHKLQLENLHKEKISMLDKHSMQMKILHCNLELAIAKLNNYYSSVCNLRPP